MPHVLTNNDSFGYVALKYAAEDRERWRCDVKNLLYVQQKTSELN